MISPSRTINLGNFNSAKLDAGIEIVFDKPVEIDGEEIKEAFIEARKIVKDEFIEQYKPYKQLLNSKVKGGEQK